MKKIKIQGKTYLVLTNGSLVEINTTSIKRIHVLDKDVYTEHYWNPQLISQHLDWNENWDKFNWSQQP